MKKNTFKTITFIVYVIAIIIMAIIVIPLIKNYKNPQDFKAFINSMGPWGFVMMLFVQVAQIIVALIPGELVEFVAGTIYGWFGGMIFCLIGIALGQFIIFKAVKLFGKDFVDKAAGSNTLNKFKFLQDEKRLKTVIFLLFFIPGTPKDLITYAVPFTKISLRDFLIITILARIPSVVSSTYAGDAYAAKDFWTLAIVYGIIIVFSLTGVILYRRWENKQSKKTVDKAL